MSIRIERLTKLYDGNAVISDYSLEVREGELCVLLGPSGSGKSTVLRAIAGLTHVDAGRIVLHGTDVTDLPPRDRGIGFVFQSYALFRHLSVAENVAFALAVRGASKAEKRQRCDELLELVGLAGFGKRMPHQLSGGQQQRVGLARALAHRPRVLLLDEPFGALDARIRGELRRGLRQIQRDLGITTIFVTHDQEEAFELGDRIAIMARGRLVEAGEARDLYLRPQTEAAARFLGGTNILVGQTVANGVSVGPVELPMLQKGPAGRRVQVLFRPEDVLLAPPGDASPPALGVGVVEHAAFTGPVERVVMRMPTFVGVRAISPAVPFGADYFLVDAARPPHESRRFPLRRGDRALVCIRRIHVLTHPGLHFVVATDGSAAGRVAAGLGGTLGRLARARILLLARGDESALERAKQELGSGLESLEARACRGDLGAEASHGATLAASDLVIAAARAEDRRHYGEQILSSGQHHVLFAGPSGEVPGRVLVCATTGEPAKSDVTFTARLVRHLRAQATVLTVLPQDAPAELVAQAGRFLEASARTMEPLGVPARTVLARGDVEEEVMRALGDLPQLLVVGAPLPDRGGAVHLGGVVGRLLQRAAHSPVLIVRASRAA
ncbi:MAG: ATP-binding cassette domain-containing protein [Acidobacteriota bacterium]